MKRSPYYYTVSQKKRPKCFFVISRIKLGQFWWNLVHCFLKKHAAKWCKRFPPHLINSSTLPCETGNAHFVHATTELLQKETPEFTPPQLCRPNSPHLNQVNNSMWEMLQVKMYKTCIADLSMTPLTNSCRNDDMVQLGPLRSESLFQFIQISDAYFVHLLQ